jgi:hypothetical protein
MSKNKELLDINPNSKFYRHIRIMILVITLVALVGMFILPLMIK